MAVEPELNTECMARMSSYSASRSAVPRGMSSCAAASASDSSKVTVCKRVFLPDLNNIEVYKVSRDSAYVCFHTKK